MSPHCRVASCLFVVGDLRGRVARPAVWPMLRLTVEIRELVVAGDVFWELGVLGLGVRFN